MHCSDRKAAPPAPPATAAVRAYSRSASASTVGYPVNGSISRGAFGVAATKARPVLQLLCCIVLTIACVSVCVSVVRFASVRSASVDKVHLCMCSSHFPTEN